MQLIAYIIISTIIGLVAMYLNSRYNKEYQSEYAEHYGNSALSDNILIFMISFIWPLILLIGIVIYIFKIVTDLGLEHRDN